MAQQDKRIIDVTEGYRPGDILRKGYQPQVSQSPQGRNPPKGGSNVMPPPRASDNQTQTKK